MTPSPAPPPIGLEVCIASLRDARIAIAAGATRVELNCAIELGGLTPPSGLAQRVIESAQPVCCGVIAMVRPRPGGFAYDTDDLRVMQDEVEHLLSLGVDGVAFGVLKQDGAIDAQACEQLLKPVHAADKQAVFHRAFDVTPDPLAALDALIGLGFTRVLTSGQQPGALAGAGLIRAMIEHADGRIGVLPGGGIRAHNVAEFIHKTGCREVHASLRSTQADDSMSGNPAIRFNADPMPESEFGATDAEKAAAMMRALDRR